MYQHYFEETEAWNKVMKRNLLILNEGKFFINLNNFLEAADIFKFINKIDDIYTIRMKNVVIILAV